MKKSPGEFELIARLCADLPKSRRTVLGPGDDCAVLATGASRQLFTIDSMVEGVHFRVGWGTPESLGARALTVNLSDIAAMGGTPTACVVNLAIRPGLDARFFDKLYAGLRKQAREAGVDIVGGNVTSSETLSITIALLGDAADKLLGRDGARRGDEIYVTGTVGDATLGWQVLDGRVNARGRSRAFLIDRFLNPTARLEAGRRLAAMASVTAAIDLSDGLWQDLGHILERSDVGAEIDSSAIPLSPAYRAVCGDDPEVALGGGEDYELLFCMRPGESESALSRRLKLPVTRVGRIIRGDRAVLLDREGVRRSAPRRHGWDQLRTEV